MRNTERPDISVIVPVYRAEKYISGCIESILNQTLENFELLLVDDGSPDESGRICDEYARKDGRITVVHKKNEGVSMARNTGIDMAKANWVCFIDSDDWVENNYLEIFDKCKNENSIVMQGMLYDFGNNIYMNKPFFEYENISFGKMEQDNIVKYNILGNGCPCGKLFNKRLLNRENIRFRKDISTHEDHIFVWQYLQYVDFITLRKEITYHYMRYSEETLSTRFHPAEEYVRVAETLIREMDVLKDVMGINNREYLKKIYSEFGIDQMMKAITNSDKGNYREVVESARKETRRIKEYYIPGCGIYKVLAKCIKMNLPTWVIYTILKVYKLINKR